MKTGNTYKNYSMLLVSYPEKERDRERERERSRMLKCVIEG